MAQAVGNYGGVPFTYSAGAWTGTNFGTSGTGAPLSGTDTGPIMWKQFPWGKFKNFQFQLAAAANSTIQVAAYGTMDSNTASGAASNWFMLPAPATEAQPQWGNPLTVNNPALYVTAGVIALRLLITSGATPGAGTVFVGVLP